MLTIRMQRTGRKGRANFRVVIQDSRQSPSSGRVVKQLGNYNPHSKELVIDKDQVSFYLSHGAQPSDKVARLLKKEGVKLPEWVVVGDDIKRTTRNPEKLRKNRPAEEKPQEPATKDEPKEEDANEEPEAAEVKEADVAAAEPEKPESETAESPEPEAEKVEEKAK